MAGMVEVLAEMANFWKIIHTLEYGRRFEHKTIIFGRCPDRDESSGFFPQAKITLSFIAVIRFMSVGSSLLYVSSF